MAHQVVVRPLSVSQHGDFDLYARSGGWNLQDFMRFESLRLRSFSRTSLSTSPLILASVGFYLTPPGNTLRCFSCGIRHEGEQIPARPASTRHRGWCLHARGRDPRNVTFGSCRLPQLYVVHAPDQPVSYNGHILWKIGNYKQERQLAMVDQFRYLESPPFYTSSRGYKMCARIYLNGQGIGRFENVQFAVVCFVILEGEHDSSISWPFRKRVTLCLLNQGRGENILETFSPRASSSIVRRPVFEGNILIDLRDLELPNRGFLVNNSIVVNVRVTD